MTRHLHIASPVATQENRCVVDLRPNLNDQLVEAGGVMVTLAAMCNTLGVDISAAAETELARVWTKIDAIRAKQAAKPTGSALPIAELAKARGQ